VETDLAGKFMPGQTLQSINHLAEMHGKLVVGHVFLNMAFVIVLTVNLANPELPLILNACMNAT
jgi:hypothetical protein